MSTPIIDPNNNANNNNNNPYTNFQAGVTAALRSWSALKTAVEQSWGGSTSTQKAEELRTQLFLHFDGTSPKPRMQLEELEDNLLAYMEDEFGIVLEDKSEIELAALIMDMYELCGKGDVVLANSVVENAIRAEMVLKESSTMVKSVIQSGDDDDDDDDMEDDSDVEGDNMVGGDHGGDAMTMTDANVAAAAAAGVGEMQQQQQQISQPAAQQQQLSTVEAYAAGYLFGGPPKPKKELPPPRQLGDAEPEMPQPVLDDDGFAPVVTKRKGKKR